MRELLTRLFYISKYLEDFIPKAWEYTRAEFRRKFAAILFVFGNSEADLERKRELIEEVIK